MRYSETQKRLRIARDISSQLEGIVRGVLLGGSMGFGQNYSVTKDSDIDLIIVSDIDKIDIMNKKPYFENQTPKDVLDMWKNKKINCFWVTRYINNIKVDAFIYESENYEDFCLLRGYFTGFSEPRPADVQINHTFGGRSIKISRNVRPTQIGRGFLYTKPALSNRKFVGIYPTMDFIESCDILYEQNNFLTGLQEQVWRRVIEQLVKEHGKSVNLSKFNVLNAHWVYQERPEKFPLEIAKRIQEKTRKLLNEYLSLDK